MQENLGPSEEADAEFAKELAKMVTDMSAESRKVDKKTALAMWDSTVLPPTIRKKRAEEDDGQLPTPAAGNDVMNFTVLTKRGNRQQVSSQARFEMRAYYLPDPPTGRPIYGIAGSSNPHRSTTG